MKRTWRWWPALFGLTVCSGALAIFAIPIHKGVTYASLGRPVFARAHHDTLPPAHEAIVKPAAVAATRPASASREGGKK
jgi:hypothetical protein